MASFPGQRGTGPALGNLVQSVAAVATSSTAITVSWSAVTPAPVNYRVYRNGTLIASPATTSFGDTGLSPSTTYAYQVSAVNAVGEGARTSPAVNATTSSGGTAKNWNPGHWMGSNNINGTGANNQNEMNNVASAIAAGANVLGWVGIYQWPAFESALGVYNFSNIVTDFTYLQSVAPGAHFGLFFWAENFSGTTASSCGTPSYILNNPGTYGPGQDGTHGGYWPFSFSPPTLSGGSAAVWRSAVMARYIALFQALAATQTRPGFTFATDPLVEMICDQETSLSLATGSDYGDSGLVTQTNLLHDAMAAAFTRPQIAAQMNFVANQANMGGLISHAVTDAIAISGPDVYPSAPAHYTWGQAIYTGDVWNGSAFVPGGTDLRGTVPYIGFVQQATTTHFAGTTPAQIYASLQLLQATHAVWVYLVGGAFDWTSVMVPFIKANPFTAPYPTGYYP